MAKGVRRQKVFIPMTFDMKTSETLTDSEFILLLFCLASLVVLNLVTYYIFAKNQDTDSFFGTKWFLLIGVLISIYFPTKTIRIFVIHEQDLKRMYSEMLAHEITDISPFYSSLDYNENRIQLDGGDIVYVVRAIEGYKFGRPESHRDTHFQGVATFMDRLVSYGCSVEVFNIDSEDANIKGLLDTQQELVLNKDLPMYALASRYLKTTQQVCEKYSSVYETYYVIRLSNLSKFSKAKEEICRDIEELSPTLYKYVELLNFEDIMKFVQKLYKLNYIAIDELTTKALARIQTEYIHVWEYYYTDGSKKSDYDFIEVEPEEKEQETISMSDADDLNFGDLLANNPELNSLAGTKSPLGKVVSESKKTLKEFHKHPDRFAATLRDENNSEPQVPPDKIGVVIPDFNAAKFKEKFRKMKSGGTSESVQPVIIQDSDSDKPKIIKPVVHTEIDAAKHESAPESEQSSIDEFFAINFGLDKDNKSLVDGLNNFDSSPAISTDVLANENASESEDAQKQSGNTSQRIKNTPSDSDVSEPDTISDMLNKLF